MDSGHWQLIIRWVHILGGIIWIGNLYFFNWTNVHFEKILDAEMKKKVVPELRGRALYWFRWGAMITFLAGLILLYLIYSNELMGRVPFGDNIRFHWILMGSLFGTIMWFNVWFVIWPRQKKILTAIRDGQAPEAAMVAMAGKASRLNTYLSYPMLAGMIVASHSDKLGMTAGTNFITLVIVVVITFAISFMHLNRIAGKIKLGF